MKKFCIIIVVFYLFISLSACKGSSVKKIGDSYLGGVIAYINPDGKSGIVAAKHNLDLNTQGGAIKACGELKEGGYSDWFLPSIEDLNKIYENRSKVGGFDAKDYWSSLEKDAEEGWAKSFSDTANIARNWKTNYIGVRCIRLFE